MKGLVVIPQKQDIVQAMNRLQKIDPQLDDFSFAFSFCRFDPRLAETFILAISRRWKNIDAMKLNDQIRPHIWAGTLGVLLEHVRLQITDKKLYDEFTRWMRTALYKISLGKNEFFWIGLDPFAGKRMRKSVENSLAIYTRWGFFGDELLLNKAVFFRSPKTILPRPLRLQKLKDLAQSKERFVLADYMEALEGKVQKRTAELDLKSASFLQRRGNTRSRTYRLKNAGSFSE